MAAPTYTPFAASQVVAIALRHKQTADAITRGVVDRTLDSLGLPETKNRKMISLCVRGIPDRQEPAADVYWEVRIGPGNHWRANYDIVSTNATVAAQVWAVCFKGRQTTQVMFARCIPESSMPFGRATRRSPFIGRIPMQTRSVRETRDRLSRLLRADQPTVILSHGRPVGVLHPLPPGHEVVYLTPEAYAGIQAARRSGPVISTEALREQLGLPPL